MIQEYIDIGADDILKKTAEMKNDGYRLVQICATTKGMETQIMYSFDKEFSMMCLKITITGNGPLESISGMYWPAFIYENEIHDLFDIEFINSKLDYKGNFFKLSVATPWKAKTSEGE